MSENMLIAAPQFKFVSAIGSKPEDVYPTTSALRPFRLIYPAANGLYRQACGIHSHLHVTQMCRAPGLLTETLDILLRSGHVDFSLIDRRQLAYVESIEAVANGEGESAVTVSDGTLLHPNLTFSYPIPGVSAKFFAIGTAMAPNDWWHHARSFLSVYGPWVWLCLLLTVVFIKLCATLTHLSRTRSTLTHANALLTLLAAFVSILFSGLYKTGLLSNIVQTKQLHQFDNLNELFQIIDGGRTKLLISPVELPILQRVHGFGVKETLTENPPLLTQGLHVHLHHLSALRDGRAVSFMNEFGATILMKQAVCHRLRLVPLPEVGEQTAVLVYNAQNVDIETRNRLNQAIIATEQAIHMIKDRYLQMLRKRTTQCRDARHQLSQEQEQSLKVTNVFGIILILAIGFVAAFICVVIECLIVKIKRRLV